MEKWWKKEKKKEQESAEAISGLKIFGACTSAWNGISYT